MKHPCKTSAIVALMAITQAHAEPIRLLGLDDCEWRTTPEGVAHLHHDGAFDLPPVQQ